MFSLKEWNFEEYKAAVNEIQDPVERMDEINYSIKSGWDEIRDYDGVTVIIGKTIEEFEEEVRKYRILKEWGTKEIENIKFLHAEAITRKKNQAWPGHFRLPYPLAWNMKSYRFFSKHFDRVEEKKMARMVDF